MSIHLSQKDFGGPFAPSYIFLVFFISSIIFSGVSARGEENPVKPSSIAELIEMMGDSDFQVREDATQKIMDQGIESLAPLHAAENHPNAEIRFRVQRMLKVVEKNDLVQRVGQFEKSKDLHATFDLPCAKKFLDQFGYTADMRQAYSKMIKSEQALLNNFERRPNEAIRDFPARLTYFTKTVNHLDPDNAHGSALTFLFMLQDKRVKTTAITDNYICSLCTNSKTGIHSNLTKGQESKVVKKLVGDWMSEAIPSYSVLRLAMQLKIKEGMEPAKKIIDAPGQNSSHYLGIAYYVIYQQEGEEAEKYLKGKLASTRVVYQNVQSGSGKALSQTLDCDAALYSLLLRHKQDPKQYGYTAPAPRSTSGFQVQSIGFRSKEAREKALQQWKEFSKSLEKKKKESVEEEPAK